MSVTFGFGWVNFMRYRYKTWPAPPKLLGGWPPKYIHPYNTMYMVLSQHKYFPGKIDKLKKPPLVKKFHYPHRKKATIATAREQNFSFQAGVSPWTYSWQGDWWIPTINQFQFCALRVAYLEKLQTTRSNSPLILLKEVSIQLIKVPIPRLQLSPYNNAS